MKRQYIKRDRKYWYENRKQHYFNKAGIAFLFILTALLLGYLFGLSQKAELVSANGSEILTHTQIISCETPKGYLECQVYAGKITWAEHDRMSKVIQCESRWNPEAVNTKNKNGSWDRGLVQINSIHKDISNADAFNFKKSIDWMIKKMHKDGNLNAWVCNRIIK